MRSAADVAAAAQLACLLEASAPKPGNVCPGRPFSDARYEDFLASAVAIRLLQVTDAGGIVPEPGKPCVGYVPLRALSRLSLCLSQVAPLLLHLLLQFADLRLQRVDPVIQLPDGRV